MSITNSTRNSLLLIALCVITLGACSDQPVAEAASLEAATAETEARAEQNIQNNIQDERAEAEAVRGNCVTCGRVRSITAVTEEGDSTGVGAVLGAIVGGLAGNQVGGGSGKKIATVAGAVGGAVAGNTIEKNRDTDVMYDVRIEMENGTEQNIRVPDATGISVGSDVTVEGNQIYLR